MGEVQLAVGKIGWSLGKMSGLEIKIWDGAWSHGNG